MEIKDTLLLPKTDFSMKADLPNKEPSILEKWKNDNIYYKLRSNYVIALLLKIYKRRVFPPG